MKLGDKLVALRAARGWSQDALAEKSGVTGSAISRIERSARVPHRTTLLKLAQAFTIDVESLLDPHLGADELIALSESPGLAKGERIPVVSWSTGGDDAIWKSEALPESVADEWIERPPNVHGPNIYALRISGHSMSPVISEGDIVVVDFTRAASSGDLVLVKILGGDLLVRIMKRQAGRLLLLPINMAFEPMVVEESRLAGPPRRVAAILKH